MSKALVEKIKKHYPNPEVCPSEVELINSTGYCVGGAICMEFGHDMDRLVGNPFTGISWEKINFPHFNQLGYVLKNYFNRKHGSQILGFMSTQESNALADRIIRANDEGNFKKAWWYVEQFLGGAKPEITLGSGLGNSFNGRMVKGNLDYFGDDRIKTEVYEYDE